MQRSTLIGGLPRHPVFHPGFQDRREQIRVVPRCSRDIDGRWVLRTFVQELAAAGSAKLPGDPLRRPVGAWVARENFDLPAVERHPRDRWGTARSAAGGAVTNAGVDGLPGNAEPNRRTETAALIDLHDDSRRRSRG